jgi:mxaJ protein
MVYGDYAKPAPISPIVAAVASGEVDVAIVWGPIAGYFAPRQPVPLTLTPILFDPSHLTLAMTYDIAMGVAKENVALASQINDALARRRAEIDLILMSYGVPRTDASSRLGGVP